MALVALDGMPLVAIGQPFVQNGQFTLSVALNNLMDAANEAVIMVGQIITDDAASHTIDTTGSSSLGWRAGAVTFSNVGTTVKVGLATVNTTTGPPVRATNASDVITFSVSKSMTGGGGGVTANAWQTHVPDTGSMTVANGDLIAFCVQMTARGGSDVVNMQTAGTLAAIPRPSVTNFVSAAYSNASSVPNGMITFSDGHLGWFYGGSIFTTAVTTQTWNSGSATKEYGNFFQLPFPVKIYGLIVACDFSGDADVVLYSTPLGTPAAEKTVSIDANTTSLVNARYSQLFFSSPYTTTASQPIAAIVKPGASNVSMPYKTFDASAHQVTEMCGTNGYAVNRASGAFAAQNSNKDRFAIGLLVGAFDAGGGGRVVQVNNDSLVA